MKRDSLFLRLFKELPGCFFQLVGRSGRDAERYQLDAVEYKSTAVRLDGVFRPREAETGPAYIWEAQFYASNTVYANLMAKIGRFLERDNPEQDWVAAVIYPNRGLEQVNLRPYRCLVDSDQLIRVYLDELPPAPPDRFEMGILELIAAQPESALAKAKAMVPRIRAAKLPEHDFRMLPQFVETVIVHQFPDWSREEIKKMLQVLDVTQTRVFQEGVEQGREEGIEIVARRMLEKGRPVAEIADVTGLTPAHVRRLKPKRKK
jgi:predicted transposase/invertase (TIGR01784 family)